MNFLSMNFLRNFGFVIALFPSSPLSGTGCPVLVLSGILPVSGLLHGVGILAWDDEGCTGGLAKTSPDVER